MYGRAYGRSHRDEGHRMITALLAHAERRPAVPVLIDLTELQGVPRRSIAEVYALRLAGGLSNRRVAFVSTTGAAFLVARFIEQISPEHDVVSASFIDRAMALEWLRGAIDISPSSDWL